MNTPSSSERNVPYGDKPKRTRRKLPKTYCKYCKYYITTCSLSKHVKTASHLKKENHFIWDAILCEG